MEQRSVEDRFWSKVQKTNTCWLWTAFVAPNGYGRFQIKGKGTGAHRVAYELAGGTLIPGLTIDHLCRVKNCVRPEHLEQVTSRVNTLRADGPPAINARKTHCVNGHEFTDGNTYIRPDGARTCKECGRSNWRNYYRRGGDPKKRHQSTPVSL